jgi:hypothetical protein
MLKLPFLPELDKILADETERRGNAGNINRYRLGSIDGVTEFFNTAPLGSTMLVRYPEPNPYELISHLLNWRKTSSLGIALIIDSSVGPNLRSCLDTFLSSYGKSMWGTRHDNCFPCKVVLRFCDLVFPPIRSTYSSGLIVALYLNPE